MLLFEEKISKIVSHVTVFVLNVLVLQQCLFGVKEILHLKN